MVSMSAPCERAPRHAAQSALRPRPGHDEQWPPPGESSRPLERNRDTRDMQAPQRCKFITFGFRAHRTAAQSKHGTCFGRWAWLSRRLSQTQRPKGRPRPRKLRQGKFDRTGHFSEVVSGMDGNQRPNEGPLYVPMGHPGQLSCPFGLFGDVRVLAPPPTELPFSSARGGSAELPPHW